MIGNASLIGDAGVYPFSSNQVKSMVAQTICSDDPDQIKSLTELLKWVNNGAQLTGFWVFGNTSNATTAPVAQTEPATFIGSSSATLNGKIIKDGGGWCKYRFHWWKSGDMWIKRTSWTGSVAGGETFSEVITGLKPGTTYWYWTEARNSAGKSDGWDSGVKRFYTSE